jgi:hypothetical protein
LSHFQEDIMNDDAALKAIAQDPTQADEDHAMLLGEDKWYDVGELRRKLLTHGELRQLRTAMEKIAIEKESEKTMTDVTRQLEAQKVAEDHSYAPPDIYGPHLPALKAASATPESAFEDEWKAARMREVTEMTIRLAAAPELPAFAPPEIRTLTDEELDAYAPPDPYAADIAKLRTENR